MLKGRINVILKIVIGYLKGKLLFKSGNQILVETGGVGYEVIFSSGILNSGYNIGQEIEIYVHTYVREDQLTLFGFSSINEKEIFRQLIGVSGVGPKTALSIISAGGPENVTTAILDSDVGWFAGISGIGKKTAQRIIIDLKGKIGGQELDLSDEGMKAKSELIAALKSMGFSLKEISSHIQTIDFNVPLSDQIRMALKNLGKNG